MLVLASENSTQNTKILRKPNFYLIFIRTPSVRVNFSEARVVCGQYYDSRGTLSEALAHRVPLLLDEAPAYPKELMAGAALMHLSLKSLNQLISTRFNFILDIEDLLALTALLTL